MAAPVIGGTSTTPSGGTVLGAPAGQQAPIDPRTLDALGQRVATTDPGLAGDVGRVLSTPLGFVGDILHTLAIPGDWVRQHLLNTTSGSQYLKNQGVKGNGFLQTLERQVGGFGLDLATDPITYLTGGAEGITKEAASKTLLQTGLTHMGAEGLPEAIKASEAGGQSLAEWAATHSNPAVRDFAAATQGQASYARALQNAERLVPTLHTDLTDEAGNLIAKALPDNISGGIRLRIPMGEKLGIEKEITLIPGATTSKLTAPLAEALKEGVVPDALKGTPVESLAQASAKVSNTLGHALSRSWDVLHGARAQDLAENGVGVAGPAGSGLAGQVMRDAEAASNRGRVAAMDSANQLVKQVTNAFGSNPEDRKAFISAVESPGSVPLSEAQKEVVDKFTKSFAPDLLKRATDVGLPAPSMGPTWFPHVYTAEARAALTGSIDARNPLGQIIMSANPSSANARLLQLPFDEAQAVESARLSEMASKAAGKEVTVKAFEDDPVRAILRNASDTNNKIAGKQLEQALTRSQLLRSSLKETGTGVSKAELDRLGVAPADARRAFMEGASTADHPWINELSPQTRAGLAADADAARSKSEAALPGLAAQRGRSENYLSRLVTTKLGRDQVVESSAEKFGQYLDDLHSRLDAVNNYIPQYEADRLEAMQRFQEATGRLDNLKQQWEQHRLPSGALTTRQGAADDRVFLKEQMDETRTAANKALSDFRSADSSISGLNEAKASIEKSLLKGGKSEQAQRVLAAIERSNKSESLIDAQQAKLDSLDLRKTYAEAGLTPGGDEWPMVFKDGAMPQGWRTINQASIGVFNGKPAPAWLANEIENVLRLDKTSDLMKAVDQYTNFFRRIVTVPFPHFWLKRAEGAWFVNLLGGVTMGDTQVGHELVQAIKDGLPATTAIGGKSLGEWRGLLESQGILKNPALGETSDILRQTEGSLGHQAGFGIPGLKQVAGAANKAGAKVLQTIDDTARAAAFVHAYEATGSAEAARLFVLQRHGDFSEMTPFEKQFMARVLPFYKWIRVKTPLVLQNLVENPGRIVNTVRAQQDILGDPQLTQQYYANGMMPAQDAFKGGFMAGGVLDPLLNAMGIHGPTAVTTDLPLYTLNSDLNPLADIHPVLQTIIGLGTHTQIWPNGVQPLKMTTPVKGVYRYAAQAMEHIPLLSKLVARTPGGDLRMDSRVYELLSQLPSSSVASVADSLPDIAGGSGASSMKVFTPFTTTPITPKVEQGQLAGQQAALNNLVSELYRQGYSQQFKENNPTARTKKGVLG